MKTRWMWIGAALLVAGCGSSGSGSGSGAGSGAPAKGAASGFPAAKKGDSAPGSAAVANPEENYVAAAVKIGCLGVESENADGYNKERAAVLSAHSYTDDTWKAASKQYGTSKGEVIVKAMEGKCPPDR